MTYTVRAAGDPASLAPAMRAALREVDPNQPSESMATMQELIDRTTAEPLFQARLLTGFSVLALALAGIGIYGVLAHSVAARTHEIGIRMALGAERGDVMRMVLRRAMTLAAVAIALSAVAFAAGWIPARRATKVDPLVALRYE
jgi:putative ABC transport system permease protein